MQQRIVYAHLIDQYFCLRATQSNELIYVRYYSQMVTPRRQKGGQDVHEFIRLLCVQPVPGVGNNMRPRLGKLSLYRFLMICCQIIGIGTFQEQRRDITLTYYFPV